MWLPTRCSYLRRTSHRSLSWPLGQPTSSGWRPSAVTTALEAPAWRSSLRPWSKVNVGEKKTRKRLVYEMFMNGLFLMYSSDFFVCFFFFSERSQNNIAVILGAAVGGAAMLLIVVVVLLLRRRLVIIFPCLCVCLSVCVSVCLCLSVHPSLSVVWLHPLPAAYSLIILPFLCGASKWPLHSLSLHLSLSVLLWPTCSLSLSGSMSRHSLEKNLHWMHLVIFQWLYSSECWILWKEISQGWYIVGKAATL